MFFRKVVGGIRIEAGTNGADKEFALNPKSGGRYCKNVQVMVKVVNSSDNAKVGIKIKHGPDGMMFKELAALASATVPGDKIFVLDTVNIVGEFVQIVLVGGGTATGDWAVVDVYEMRKPY